MLAAVQHPGEVSGATPDNPASTYPYLGDGQPRPGVFHAYRPKGNGGGNGNGRGNGNGNGNGNGRGRGNGKG